MPPIVVEAAQMIRPYTGPSWLVEPHAEPSDEDDLAAINAAEVSVLDRNVRGWGEYNAIIRVTDGEVQADYLARLA